MSSQPRQISANFLLVVILVGLVAFAQEPENKPMLLGEWSSSSAFITSDSWRNTAIVWIDGTAELARFDCTARRLIWEPLKAERVAEIFWRLFPRTGITQRLDERVAVFAPNDQVSITCGFDPFVTLDRRTGSVKYGDGYEPTFAEREFWLKVAKAGKEK